MDNTVECALSVEVLTSFKTTSLLESHLIALMNSTYLKNSTNLSDICVLDFCKSLKNLANLEGHVCRVKDENYAIHRISNDLIKDAIPYFFDVFNSFLKNSKEQWNINDLIADYSKEEIFCIRLELGHLRSTLKERKNELKAIMDGMSKFKKSTMLSELFGYMSVLELVAMTRDDFEDYLEEHGCSENDVVRLSTLRELVVDNEVLQTAIFMTQEPVTDIYSLSLQDRLNGARVQLLAQDLDAVDRLLGIV